MVFDPGGQFETKPAMASSRRGSTSMAAELMARITLKPYKQYVSSINECDAVTIENFKNSNWANYFWIDATNTVRNGKVNPNHLFDLFGKFNGKTATEVRTLLLQNIADNIDFYDRCSAVCLQMRSIGFDTWVESISNERVFCDELCLTGLSFMYGRHTLVLTNNKMWSTIEMQEPLGLVELLKECSIRLIYLGQLRFGLLHWNPRLPRPLPAPKPPSFNIIEEYTLDDSPSTTSAPLPNPVHVGTKPDSADTSASLPVDVPVHDIVSAPTPMELDTEHVGTGDVVDESATLNTCDPLPFDLVTCPEDGLVLSQYPWKKSLRVVVQKLSDIEADIWCGNTSGYYQYVPDPDPDTLKVNILLVRGYGLKKKGIGPTLNPVKTKIKTEQEASDQEPSKLIEHANALIRNMRSLATDPVDKAEPPKPIQKRKKPLVPVETNTPNALEQLHNSTVDKLAVVGEPDTSDQPKPLPSSVRCVQTVFPA